MSPRPVVVEATLKPDGTLELDEKLALPPGRVQVMVQPLPELPDDDPFWQMMKRIWAGQKARGHVPRSAEEIEAERAAFREEAEEKARKVERLQEECARARPRPAPPGKTE